MPDPAKARSSPVPDFSSTLPGSSPAGQVTALKGMSSPPGVTLPRGGGALRGIGEKFAANPVTGVGSLDIPIPLSPGRGGFSPEISLSYSSGAGNGPFGFGWALSVPSITRKTDKGLPRYLDEIESDVFILSGAEDLVPELDGAGNLRVSVRPANGAEYRVQRYRPRIEGLFARIERWTRLETGETHWRILSRDNITTLFGTSGASRVSDPADPQRVFSWLISEARDDKGNAIVYGYKPENSEGVDLFQVNEKNRTEESRSANRYLKRVKYGNRISHLIQPDLSRAEWLFEAVFDYGEHDLDRPLPPDSGRWLCREDPFSCYRSAFEVRTYRLCQRVLMFHHFPDEPGVGRDCLVRSTDLTYRGGPERAGRGQPIASFIGSVTQSGYKRRPDGAYRRQSLPALEFSYSEAHLCEDVREVDPRSRKNLPGPASGRWVDLDGEGLAGMLSRKEGVWFYNRNLGGGLFGPPEVLSGKPSGGRVGGPPLQFMDLAGDGQLDLVQLQDIPGFYERSLDGGWEPFTPFGSLPNVPWDDPNLRLVDLTGDGRADVLITEGQVFTWYPSQAEKGFGPSLSLPQASDEEKGPRLLFAEGLQSVYLADMSGDGLCDLVRIRNGEVCYWPNLGYGRFGAKVTMDHAPRFDRPEQFEPGRIRLGDVDGSGTADLFYLGREGATLWRNQGGNSWNEPRRLAFFVPPESMGSAAVLDLLGCGTACLVWPASAGEKESLRYVELMGEKPHLLVGVKNNLGAETLIQYAPSTKFYLRDRDEGRPWITRLPFPVHVVERVETREAITGNRLVTRYAYHHGYFDGEEREFRGFGRVEQWDTEELGGSGPSPVSGGVPVQHVPPVLTRTWFHTGSPALGRGVTRLYDQEYFLEPGLSDDEAGSLLLPDALLPPGLSPEESREACRALKGTVLRRELFGQDGSPQAPLPYTVTEANYRVRRVQPRGGQRHGVFFVHPGEAIDFQYERKLYDSAGPFLPDPRTVHSLTLEVDDYGNVLRSAAVAYGRRRPDPALAAMDREKQARTSITWTENRFTNPVDTDDSHRTPLPCESSSYELTGPAVDPVRRRFSRDELLLAGREAAPIPYEQPPSPGVLEKRRIGQGRALYRRDDLSGALPLAELESLAVPFESYDLAFTPGLVSHAYGDRAGEEILSGPGGYVRLEGDENWWMPSGRVFYSESPDPETELAFARQHFFAPFRFQDPFGNVTTLAYDRYDLMLLETRDPLQNRVTAGERDHEENLAVNGNDYRVLQPRLVMDANRNRTEVAFDALGMVVGLAVMGKPGEKVGDSLAGFDADLDESALCAHLLDPGGDPHGLLGRATMRFLYDPFAFQRTHKDPEPRPPVISVMVRERHDSDLLPGEETNIQQSFSYFDGFGREILKKIQAEPEGGTGTGAGGARRWLGRGWTIFNNKGNPVRRYEPFFTGTHLFEADSTAGVSSVRLYDPVGRVAAVLHPNHTYEKTVTDPWRQQTWDANDTVLEFDPGEDPDVGGFFKNLPESEYLPTWYSRRLGGALGAREQAAALKTARHARTPGSACLDPLGRAFLLLAHNRFERDGTTREEIYATRFELDINGRELEVRDAGDRLVLRREYDVTGRCIRQSSMESGERWTLFNSEGKPLWNWDSRGHVVSTEYDALGRPSRRFVQSTDPIHSDPRIGGTMILSERILYGEEHEGGRVSATDQNLLTRVWKHFDTAGVLTNERYDFKGNLSTSRRQLAADYKNPPDWSEGPALEAEIFTRTAAYDALNRPVLFTAPDGSVIRRSYDKASLLNRVEADLGGSGEATVFAGPIGYNARGQRESVELGNGVRTSFGYDPLTFRLFRMEALRGTEPLQSLFYTRDPSGKISGIADAALQTIYFRNHRVEADSEYTYDAVYQLIEASGREHLGQAEGAEPPPSSPAGPTDMRRTGLLHPGDGRAMGRYSERFAYDRVGNLLECIHRSTEPSCPGWTRTYTYSEPSLLEPGITSNRLSRTETGAALEGTYSYDLHGNAAGMPHLPLIQWDFRDQLCSSSRQVRTDGGTPETTYYVYDVAGERVRKVTERAAPPGESPARWKERIDLGDFEVYREYGGGSGGTVTLERETLHILDDRRRIALVETRTRGDDGSPAQIMRYQVGDAQDSAALELDSSGRIISYEEYYPFGSSSYQALAAGLEKNLKRYRYAGRERDEETGLNHHGVRYYAPWLGRWTSCDPAGLADGVNLYRYGQNDPVNAADRNGMNSDWIPVAERVGGAVIGVVVGVEDALTFGLYSRYVLPSASAAVMRTQPGYEGVDPMAEMHATGTYEPSRRASEVATGIILAGRGMARGAAPAGPAPAAAMASGATRAAPAVRAAFGGGDALGIASGTLAMARHTAGEGGTSPPPAEPPPQPSGQPAPPPRQPAPAPGVPRSDTAQTVYHGPLEPSRPVTTTVRGGRLVYERQPPPPRRPAAPPAPPAQTRPAAPPPSPPRSPQPAPAAQAARSRDDIQQALREWVQANRGQLGGLTAEDLSRAAPMTEGGAVTRIINVGGGRQITAAARPGLRTRGEVTLGPGLLEELGNILRGRF